MWQVDENEPKKIIAKRESIRNEIMSAYRAFEQTLERTASQDTEDEHTESTSTGVDHRPISGGEEATGVVVRARTRRGDRKRRENRDFVQALFDECMAN